MKNIRNISLLLFLFAVLFNSCVYDFWVEGNGEVTEEERTIPKFSEISSAGSFDIYYEYAEEPSITVSCESNLQLYVETVVYDDELKIRTPMGVNLRPHHTIEVYVEGPYVDNITLSGSGLIHTEDIETDDLTLKTSGSGRIETTFYGENLTTKLTGSGKIDVSAECDYFEATISGSGEVDMEGSSESALYKITGSGTFNGYDFEVNDLDINVSGSGKMYVNAIDYMNVNISGSGDIYYIGSPQITTRISGSGNLIDKN